MTIRHHCATIVDVIDLDTDLLRCFVAVAEAGGFTAAGQRIGLTQSGISVRIRKLEEQAGTRLLERTSRSLMLTPDGELLLDYARRILDLNDEVVRRLRTPAVDGTLRAGIADYVSPHRLPAVLARFRQHYPQVRLEISTGLGQDLARIFKRGELDVIVGCDDLLQDGILLRTERLVWVASAAWRATAGAPVPIAALPPNCFHRVAGTDALSRVGRAWDVICTCSSVAGLRATVAAGLAVAVLPESAVSDDVRELDAASGFPPLPRVPVSVFTKKKRPLAAREEAFVAFIREEMASPLPMARPATTAPATTPPSGRSAAASSAPEARSRRTRRTLTNAGGSATAPAARRGAPAADTRRSPRRSRA